LKSVGLFFLLEILLTANVMGAYKYSKNNNAKPVADTIIKLDSVRDKKLLRIKPGTDKKDIVKKTDNNGLSSEIKGTADDSTIVDKTHNM